MSEKGKCQHCGGDGYRFVSKGNPFYKTIFHLAATSERITCYQCKGTGLASLSPKDTQS